MVGGDHGQEFTFLTSSAKDNSVPGNRQTATLLSSGAAREQRGDRGSDPAKHQQLAGERELIGRQLADNLSVTRYAVKFAAWIISSIAITARSK